MRRAWSPGRPPSWRRRRVGALLEGCSRYPISALQVWLTAAAAVYDGPVFRAVSTGNRAGTRPMNPASVNVPHPPGRRPSGPQPAAYSAHSLRAVSAADIP